MPPRYVHNLVVRLLKNNALGASAGVRGHGAAGGAGGTAPAARSQTPPFHIGMGEAAAAVAAGDGGPLAGDGGAGDACAFGRGRRATGPAAQHTAAGRRVRPGCTSAAASPLSASRADAEQFPASTEQVRERRAGVGGRGDGGRRGWGARGGARRRWQEGRLAAESDALVGAHRRAAAAALPARQHAAALRDGPAPRAARRVTSPPPPPPPPPDPISRLHSIIGTIGLGAPERSRVPKYYRLGIYLFGTRGSVAVPCGCVCRKVVCVRSLRCRRVER